MRNFLPIFTLGALTGLAHADMPENDDQKTSNPQTEEPKKDAPNPIESPEAFQQDFTRGIPRGLISADLRPHPIADLQGKIQGVYVAI